MVIADNRYVDDILIADTDVAEMIQARDETTKLLGTFGFDIKQWNSNHSVIGTVKEDGNVLGLNWDANYDALKTQVKERREVTEFTKRVVLSHIAEIWDPIGLLAGTLVVGRIIFQSIVRMKVEWDEKIEDDGLLQKWNNWLSELRECGNVVLSRAIFHDNVFPNGAKSELIGFSDGSSVAHGCSLYLRWYDEEEKTVDVKFVAAKCEVNSIKGTIVPRAELAGAFLLSRLIYNTERAIEKTNIEPLCSSKMLFCDSTTVLSWIKSSSIKYKPFVKNKIIDIQELHPVKVWGYIPSRDNTTADLISKGCKAKDLEKVIKGPEFLYAPRTYWISNHSQEIHEEIDAEKIPSVLVKTGTIEQPVVDVNRFNSWKKLLRVTAYLYKFLSKTRNPENISELMPGLKEIEFKKVLRYWILQAQSQVDLSSKDIEKLSPFKDAEGFIRIYGRMKQTPLFDENRKHPIELSKDHMISMPIVKQAHEETLHPGHLRVMAEVKKQFWIVGVRCLAKLVGKNCITCRRWRGMSSEQRMSNLPLLRWNTGSPFENTTVDYFGPL